MHGKPYAGNPHVWFDEREVALTATPRRGVLLYKRLLMVTCAATMASVVWADYDLIYENDFSTRTSAKAIPSGMWRIQDYNVGLMANTDYENPFGTFSVQNMQDGWIKNKSTGTKSGANAYIYSDTGENYMAVLGHADAATIYSSQTDGRVILKNRIGNTFTNGVVTLQLDMRPPTAWQSYADGSLRRAIVCIGDEDYFSPEVDKPSVFSRTAATAGVYLETGVGRKVYYRDSAEHKTDAEVPSGNWLRVVVTLDIDSRKWGFSLYDMKAGHPSINTVIPSEALFTQSDINFSDASLTSISSIAICGFGVCWNVDGDMSAAPTAAACFDSIRISHNGEECYRNSFDKCRRRSLAAGTRTATYAADCTVTNTVGSETYVSPATGNVNGRNIVPAKEAGSTTVEPIGIDGWRRLVGNATANQNSTVGMATPNSGNPCMRISHTSATASERVAGVAHPIGTTVRSGTLRMRVDMRQPSAWGSDPSSARLYVSLGNDTLYNGYRDQCMSGRFLHAGITYGGTLYGYPCYLNASGSIVSETSVKTASNTWYRAEFTVHLDSGTFDYTLYEQGGRGADNHPYLSDADGTVVFSKSNLPRIAANGVTEISTLAVWGFRSTVYYDNIQIWHTPPGATEETLLYRNSFSSRTVCQPGRSEGKLTGTLMKDPEGQDGWTAVDIGTMGAYFSGDDNPAMYFKNPEGSYGYAVHELGQTVSNGIIVAQVDMRPPRGWWSKNDSCSGSVYVRFGGDSHYLGQINTDSTKFYALTASGFGFKHIAGNRLAGIYTNVALVAWQGNRAGGGSMTPGNVTVDTTHWYRFVATMDLRKSQYDVAAYDMGTTHPTLSTPSPAAPAARFSALPFRYTTGSLGGISAFSVNANYTYSSPLDDTLQPYVDNIRIRCFRRGICVSFR